MSKRRTITKEGAIQAVVAMASSKAKKDLPKEERVVEIVSNIETLLFPEYSGLGYFGEEEAVAARELASVTYEKLYGEVLRALRHSKRGANTATVERKAKHVTNHLFSQLPGIREALTLDIEAAYKGDPAAQSHDDIIIYPGFQAIIAHRIAHELYADGIPLVPRIINEYAHSRTGIDINPGAKIGRYFFIDHGTGVVIGETAEIGDWVRIYQGVTLGALSLHDVESKRGKKRHPTIEDNVTIYAGTTILGGETVVGKGCIIGGGVLLTKSVEADTVVKPPKPDLTYKKNGKAH